MGEDRLGTILLVDDEAIIGLATKQKLSRLGYAVELAVDGAEAMAALRGNPGIGLVLMDIDLGRGANGIELCKEIAASADLPVVFVSSHTEPEIVSLTEQVTSYGYIVKSSSVTVYDASIKMAHKLFRERKRTVAFSKYLAAALNNVAEPIFICDRAGDVVFFNTPYLRLQGLETPADILGSFREYQDLIEVFSAEGERLPPEEWASMRGLRGLVGVDVAYFVYHRRLRRLMANRYAYAPILDDKGEIIGSYVKISPRSDPPDPALLAKVEEELARASRDGAGSGA